jgi:hypothetical protein
MDYLILLDDAKWLRYVSKRHSKRNFQSTREQLKNLKIYWRKVTNKFLQSLGDYVKEVDLIIKFMTMDNIDETKQAINQLSKEIEIYAKEVHLTGGEPYSS